MSQEIIYLSPNTLKKIVYRELDAKYIGRIINAALKDQIEIEVRSIIQELYLRGFLKENYQVEVLIEGNDLRIKLFENKVA